MTEPSYDVELRHVSKRYGNVEAVRDVSLSVGQGEFVAILGPTGCGKSTTLRLIGGLEEPDLGEVFLAGRDMTDLDPAQRPTNTVFQQYALFPHMTAFQNVAYGLQVRRVTRPEIRRRVAEMFALVRLEGKEDKRPNQLSGGEQQRVALARALINHPRILLLDEPLSSIDQALRASMQEQLRELQRQLGITFVLVTHDQQEALTMADRVAIMREGRVEQIDASHHIYDHPASVFVARFLGEVNLLAGTVIGSSGEALQVQSAAGRLEAVADGAADAPYVDGQELTVAVRPERVVLGPEAQTLPNHVACTVVQEIFRGPTRSTILQLASGQTLKAVSLSHTGERLAPGTPCTAGWRTEHATALAR